MEKIIQQKNWRLQRKRGRRGERKKGERKKGGRKREEGGREKGGREGGRKKEEGGRKGGERINQEMERIISLTVASVSTNVSILIIRKSFELGG